VTELIVSLSGLADDLAPARELAAALDARDVPLTHLLRPAAAPAELIAWLRERCGGGDALALHGYDHTQRPLGNARGRRGEFACLPRHEAGLRLTAARRTLTASRLWTDVFAPPRWLASDGTVAALSEQGFRVLADETGIRDLAAGSVVPARVLGFRAVGSLMGAEVAWTVRRGGPVRINVRAKDLRRPDRADAVVAAVDATLQSGVVPATYRRPGRRVA
jgi:predicted deacetylase